MARSVDLPLVAVSVNQARFREKVTAYIREHRDHVAIQRLRRNMSLTETDLGELERLLIEQRDGTPEALETVSGERGLGIDIAFPNEAEADAVVTVLRNTERATTPAAQAGAMSSA